MNRVLVCFFIGHVVSKKYLSCDKNKCVIHECTQRPITPPVDTRSCGIYNTTFEWFDSVNNHTIYEGLLCKNKTKVTFAEAFSH